MRTSKNLLGITHSQQEFRMKVLSTGILLASLALPMLAQDAAPKIAPQVNFQYLLTPLPSQFSQKP